MNPIKFFSKKLSKFLKSIDTITTKLLTLVLFTITIPLMVIGNVSTDIINQSTHENSNIQLELNKKILEEKNSTEINELRLLAQNILEKISNARSRGKGILKELQKSNDLDFCTLIARDDNFRIKSAQPDKVSSYNIHRIVNIAFLGEVFSSREKIDDDLYNIVAIPVFTGNNKISSVLLVGKSLKKSLIPKEIKNLTNATVIFYKADNDKASIINSNSNIYPSSLKIDKGAYFDGMQINNPDEFTLAAIPIKDYFNKIIGYYYIGIPKNEFIMTGDSNIKSMGIIAIISLIAAIFIAAIFARTITDPILRLVDAAESIALGDLDHEVLIRGNDEMAQLALTFNQMSVNLKKQEHLRDNFVATLTHDLKVPMLAENQTVTYLLKGAYGDISEEQRDVLELIKSTNNSSLEMIGTLLEVYRYDSGNVRLFESEFDVVDLLKDAVSQIKSLADDRKIQININSNEERIFVKADKREIKRVLHNIISNSINNGIHRGFINCYIELVKEKRIYKPVFDTDSYTTLSKTLDLSNNVIISVEDNGIGIAREDISLLFQRFALSKGRKPSGAGLGLYYSYQVIIQHNGNVWAESSEKGGSVFKFTLPVIKA